MIQQFYCAHDGFNWGFDDSVVTPTGISLSSKIFFSEFRSFRTNSLILGTILYII